MPLLNNFKLGADPEFAVMNGAHVTLVNAPLDPFVPWGIDHGGYVVEPHPKPDVSVRNLVANMRVAMNDFATVAPTGRWRAGAYLQSDLRPLTFGGHVHIDKPTPGDEIKALDLFTQHLEKLDILPAAECVKRRGGGHYGKWSDVRVEHGHFEYRTFPSTLFSQRVTKLCYLAAKLATVDPASVKEELGRVETTSLPKLKAFYERFKGKDDDVDWLLDGGVFTRKLNIDPDKDIKEVWKITPEKENPHWKANMPKPEPRQIPNWQAEFDLRTIYAGHPDVPYRPYVMEVGRNGANLLVSVNKGLTITSWTAVQDRVRNGELPIVEPGDGAYYVRDHAFTFGCVGVKGEPDRARLFTQELTDYYMSPGGRRVRVQYLLHEDADRTNPEMLRRITNLTRSIAQGALPGRVARFGTIDTYQGIPHIVTEVNRQ